MSPCVVAMFPPAGPHSAGCLPTGRLAVVGRFSNAFSNASRTINEQGSIASRRCHGPVRRRISHDKVDGRGSAYRSQAKETGFRIAKYDGRLWVEAAGIISYAALGLASL